MIFMRVRLIQLDTLLRNWFSIDVRALSAARMFTAVLVVYNIATLYSSITPYLLGDGISLNHKKFFWLGDGFWTFHTLFNDFYFVALLMSIQIVLAVCLLFGFKTRVVTAATLVCNVSMTNAFSTLSYGGTQILHLMLFFGFFLNWGRAFSYDAYFKNLFWSSTNVYSLWSVAALLQVALLYLVSGWSKTGHAWKSGVAVEWTLNSLIWPTSIGMVVSEYSNVLSVLTIVVVWYLRFVVFLLFPPISVSMVRIVTVTELMIMHLMYRVHLRIAWFSSICSVMLLLFLPPIVWDTVWRVLRVDQRTRKFELLFALFEKVERALSGLILVRYQRAALSKIREWNFFKRISPVVISTVLALVFLMYSFHNAVTTIVSNHYGVRNLYLLGSLQRIPIFLGINHNYAFFAPDVSPYRRTSVMEVIWDDRTHSNVLHPDEPFSMDVSLERENYGNELLWITTLNRASVQSLDREVLLRHFCQVEKKSNAKPVSISFYSVTSFNQPPFERIRSSKLSTVQCDGPSVPGSK
jgi:hypothetical protein